MKRIVLIIVCLAGSIYAGHKILSPEHKALILGARRSALQEHKRPQEDHKIVNASQNAL